MGALHWLEGNSVSLKRFSVVSNQSCGLGSPNTYKCSSVKTVEFGANHQLLRLIKNMWGDVTHLNDKLPELKQPITISVLIWLFWNGFHCQLEQVRDSFAGENCHILNGNTFRQYASLSSCLNPWGDWGDLVLDRHQYLMLEMRLVYKRGREKTRTWMLYECCKDAVCVNRAGWTFSPLSHISYFLQLEWISIYIRKHSTELRKLSSYFAVFLKQASTVTCKLML